MKAMLTKLVIFRHTQSFDNLNHLFSGHRDVELTPQGLEDAHTLTDRLKGIDFRRAYVSPLHRTRKCLEIALNSHHPNTQIIIEPRLIERSYGWLQGQSKDVWATRAFLLFKLFHRSPWLSPPGGESLLVVRKRVMDFTLEMLEELKANPGNILICAHNNSLRPIRQYFEGLPMSDYPRIETPLGEFIEYELDLDNLPQILN
jgi:2,3-bisphosphoglycerate-dependent phosphoglycerate mutase